MAHSLAALVPRPVRTFVWTAREEGRQTPYSLFDKLYWWRRGFMAESAALYDFPRNDPADYVNDYIRRHRCKKINPVPALFDHKLLMRSVLLQHGFRQAETIAVITSGAIQLHPFSDQRRWASAAEMEQWLIADGGRFVVKPESSTRGMGVALIEARQGQVMRRRGNEVTPFRVPVNGVKLIERALQQHEFWDRLHPGSANSIRVLTMWTPGEPAPFVTADRKSVV